MSNINMLQSLALTFFWGFFFQFYDATKVVTIHKDDLTKFRYILDMKIKENSQ
jgi:hypothetical protein